MSISDVQRDAAAQADASDRDYDPMIYDAMREVGTQVRAAYVALETSVTDPEAAARWRELDIAHWAEVRSVNSRSLRAVEAAAAIFRDRLAALTASAPHL